MCQVKVAPALHRRVPYYYNEQLFDKNCTGFIKHIQRKSSFVFGIWHCINAYPFTASVTVPRVQNKVTNFKEIGPPQLIISIMLHFYAK